MEALEPWRMMAVVAARPADSFVDFIGVNTHFANNSGKYYEEFDTLRSRLQELGVRHVRDSGDRDSTGWRSRATTLRGDGIKFDLISDYRGNPIGTVTAGNPVGTVSNFIAAIGGAAAVASVEGPNEPNTSAGSDPNWVRRTRDHQLALYNAINGNPSFASIPVIGPSDTSYQATNELIAAGTFDDRVDYGNLHYYWNDRNPGNAGYGGVVNGYKYGNIPFGIEVQAQPLAPSKPVIVTETGWSNNTGGIADEAVSGTYIPRSFFEFFNYNGGADVKRVYQYQLFDDGTDPGEREHHFGLVRDDASLSRKPAFHAVKNLIGTLKEPGASFAPGSLDYALSGSTANVHQTLLQKSNGDFYLALWVEKQAEHPDTQAAQPVAPQSVTLQVNTAAMSGLTVYSLNADGSMTTSTTAKLNGDRQVTLSVPDRVTLVKITPFVGKTISIRGVANGKFVAADLNAGGRLVANRTRVSVWEQFDVVDAGGGYVAFKARANGKYVSAVASDGYRLSAQSSAIGTAEKFSVVPNAPNYGIKSRLSGFYVTTDTADGGRLKANAATSILIGQKFDLTIL